MSKTEQGEKGNGVQLSDVLHDQHGIPKGIYIHETIIIRC